MLKCRPTSAQSLCPFCHITLLLKHEHVRELGSRLFQMTWLLQGLMLSLCLVTPSKQPRRKHTCPRCGRSQTSTYKMHLPKAPWAMRLCQVRSGVLTRPLFQVSLQIQLTELRGLATHLSPSHLSQRKHLRSVGGFVKPVCKTRKAIQSNVTMKAKNSFLWKDHTTFLPKLSDQSSSALQRPFLKSQDISSSKNFSKNLRRFWDCLFDIVKKKKKRLGDIKLI